MIPMLTIETWLELAAKGTVVLAAALSIAWMLRHRSAASRHLVWAAALCALVALPLAARVVPRVPVPVPLWSTASEPAPAPDIRGPVTAFPIARTGAASAGVAPRRSNTAPPTRALALPPLSTLVLGAWLAGAALLLLRIVTGFVALRRLVGGAQEITDPVWRDRLEVTAGEVGCARAVRLLVSDRVSVPVTCGLVAPVILLPAAAFTWDEARARVVLLHELAHIRRQDCLVQVVAQCAVALHWLNPMAWIAVARLRAERERACDDLVLAAGTSGADYAEHLLEIARGAGRTSGVPGAALAMARPSELEGRLLAVLDRTRVRGVIGARAVAAALLVAIVAIAAVAAVGLEPIAEAGTAQAAAPAPTPTPAPTPAPSPRPGGRAAGVTRPQSGGVPGGVAGGVVGGVQGAEKPSGQQSDAISPAVRDSVVRALTAALKDENPEVREQAIHALANMRSPALYEPMVSALGDSNADVRHQAVFALGQLGDKRAVAPLTRALSDADADVRQQAAFALGQLRATEAVPALGGALKDADAEVRQQAAFALGQIGEAGAVLPLVGAMGDSSAEVREQAAFALGQIGDSSAVEVLTRALKDADADVREQAAFALGQLLGEARGDRHRDEKNKDQR